MKETYLKTIWSMMDSLKGVMTPEQELDLISVIAFVKSQDAEAFSRLLNVGKSSLMAEFRELIHQLSKAHAHCLDTAHFEIDSEALSKLLLKMSELSTLDGFTKVYRDAVQKTLGMRGGDNVSNSNEAHLIQALLGDVKDKAIYDGTAGLASTTSSLSAKHLWLQDINRSTAQAGSRLLKMDGQSFTYLTGNSLEQPSIKANSCDLAVMSPPLGMRLSSLERIQDQPYLLPDISAKVPTSGSDSLWLQLALYSLNKTGKAFITLAPGWLFRGGYDAKVREYLIEHELIESIVMLPQGYFSHTQIQGALIILQKDKPKGTPIRLIDVRNMGKQSRKELILESKDISLVADLYAGKIKDEAVCKDIPLSEIRAKDYNLSFSGYFVQEIEEIEINPEKELHKLADLTYKHQQSQQKLMQLLNETKA
jgi:type I restriction enzyme M protein